MKIIELGQPTKIGYYQAKAAASCKFQIFSNSIKTERRLISVSGSYKAALGIVFHDLIAELSSISEPIDRLKIGKQYIENEYKKLSQMDEFWWLEPLFSYGETSRILATVANLSFSRSEKVDRNGEFEVEILSNDALFVGRVDRILRLVDSIIIQEYKSAITSNLDDFVTNHKPQLEFYAGILMENDKNINIRGELFSGDLASIPVSFDKNAVLEKFLSLRELISSALSQSISPELLQQPSPETCLVCKLKPVCRSYKDAVSSFGRYDGSIVAGNLLSISQRNANFSVLHFENEISKNSVIISNFHPFKKKAVVGQLYTLVNLRQGTDEFEVLKTTVIYDR